MESAGGAAGRKPFPFKITGQGQYIYNVAHSDQRVRSDRPLVRLLGCVHDATEALAVLRDVPVDAPVFIATQQRFTLLSRRPEPEDAVERIDAMAAKARDACARAHAEFDKRDAKAKAAYEASLEEADAIAKKAREGVEDADAEGGAESKVAEESVSAEAKAEGGAESKEQEPADEGGGDGEGEATGTADEGGGEATGTADEGGGDGEGEATTALAPVRRWGRDREIRNQSFACVSVMLDEDKARDEPAICVWAAFASEEDCYHYIKETASTYVKEHDLLCLQMYDWVEVSARALGQIENVVYRDAELDAVMRGIDQNASDLEKYKQQCTDGEVEPSFIDLEQPPAAAIEEGTS